MMAATQFSNFDVYSAKEVASHYAALKSLSACEVSIFNEYLRKGMAILDLGVGGGRTTPYLSKIASRYVGVDYSEAMIQQCRSRFPQIDFRTGDAVRLSMAQDASFDAVVMAFNVMDYVIPDESRATCLREIRRVLKPGGRLIFSSHNPRAIFVRPARNTGRVRELASRWSGENEFAFANLFLVLSVLSMIYAVVRAAGRSVPKLSRAVLTRAFWQGDGYMMDSAHGGLLTHYWTPYRAESELATHGFHLMGTKGDDYPAPSRRCITDWFYYIFEKPIEGMELATRSLPRNPDI